MKIWSLSKHENLTTGKKYCGKEEKLLLRSNFSSFPQYFHYISNFKSPIHVYLLNMVNRIIFSWTLQIWYVEVRISRSISDSPLEFEITRVDCIMKSRVDGVCIRRQFTWYIFFKVNLYLSSMLSSILISTLVMLNKLRCHAHSKISANQITRSRFHILNGNSADPDLLASKNSTDLDLNCLQREGISGFSRNGVIFFFFF